MPNYKPVSDTENCPAESFDASEDSPENSTSTENETEATESDTGDTDGAGGRPDTHSTGKRPDTHSTVKSTGGCDISHNGDNQNGELNTTDNSNGEVKQKHRRRRAETARDLVQSQENLILMLQSMKSDLSRMDREATSIKEEVIRSRQLLDVSVGQRRIHQLDYSANGYNLIYAMPKVSYNYNKCLNGSQRCCSSLGQSSTYCNYTSNISRRSSVSSTPSRRSSYQNEIEHPKSKVKQSSECIWQPSHRKASQSEFSGTDNTSSEYESETSSGSRYPTRKSTDFRVSDPSVTNRSAERRTKRLSDYRSKSLERRQSFFFTNKSETSGQELSDDVCV